ncbi:MAG: protein kinase [Candidatus Obscuribacterales bacterium]
MAADFKDSAEEKLKEMELRETKLKEAGSEETRLKEADHEEVILSGDELLAAEHLKLVGTTVAGHYEILALIGTGGMSCVYRARHLLLDEIVAIKVILPVLAHDPRSLRRLQQEAKAASRLHHPAIAGVREFGIIDDTKPFIVMDYIEGRSLADVIADEGTVGTDRAVAILHQVCQGLEYAHEQGVVHRDIKPENIIVDASGQPKIVDFGIAKLQRDDDSAVNLTKTGDLVGTPRYMSPEQCLGKKVDGRSDIYSLGCVAYQILTGLPPFEAESAMQMIMQHINEDPVPPTRIEKKISPSLEACVLKAMAKNVEERYQKASELDEDLRLASEGGAVRFRPKKAPRLGSVKQRIVLYFFIAVFATILAAGAALWPVIGRALVLNTNLPPAIKNLIISPEEAEALELIDRATVLYRGGKLDEAAALLETGLDNKSPQRARLVQVLAVVYGLQGRLDDAEALCRQLGGDDSGTATNLHSLAYNIDALENNYKKSRPLWERAIELYSSAYGSDNFFVAKDLYNLATCDIRDRKGDAAREKLNRARPIFEKMGPEGKTWVGYVDSALASIGR